ncbi:hypothetical protein, partial [Desulfovibrio sp.]|uniref:hypothetical protein n=1 Tax=Desulfovibrio sp. TaxID=885 RepID=UPI003AAA245B
SFFFATAGWGAVLPFQKKKFLLKKIIRPGSTYSSEQVLLRALFFVFRVDWVQARSGARVDEHIS